MRWYFAAANSAHYEVLLREKVKSILVSYAYCKSGIPEMLGEAARAGRINLMLDSGAFTNFNKPGTVKLEEYMEFLKAHANEVTEYVVLDDIRKPDITYANWQTMRSAGFNPLFVDHVHYRPHDRPNAIYRTGKKICWGGVAISMNMGIIGRKVGGSTAEHEEEDRKYSVHVTPRLDGARKKPITGLHVLGVGARLNRIVNFLDIVDSFDSASWSLSGGYGLALWVEKDENGWPRMKRAHYSKLPQHMKDYASKHKLNLNDWRGRNVVGIRAFKEFYRLVEERHKKGIDKGEDLVKAASQLWVPMPDGYDLIEKSDRNEDMRKLGELGKDDFKGFDDVDDDLIVRQKSEAPAGDLFDEDYYVNMDEMDSKFVIGLAEVMKNLRGDLILEIGPGLGRAMRVLKASGEKSIHGVELSKYAVEQTQRQGLEVFHLDAEQLTFADDVYDSVFSIGVLPYVADMSKVIDESVRVAKGVVAHLVPLGPGHEMAVRSWDTFEEFENYVSDNKLGAGFAKSISKIDHGFQSAALLVIDKEAPRREEASSGGFDFEEGDEGIGIVQTHETGLTKGAAASGPTLGWDAVVLSKDRSLEQIKAHTDLRLVRGDDDFWEGGEAQTSQDLSQDNLFKQIAEGAEDVEISLNLAPPPDPPRSPEDLEKAAIASHSTPISSSKTWDGPKQKQRLKTRQTPAFFAKMFAWRNPDGDPALKSSYKFHHHEVDASGNPGAANIQGCRAIIAILNGARGGTTIPKADYQGVYDHAVRHLKDADIEPADLKKQDILRGDLSWMAVGKESPQAFAPGRLDSSETWSRFCTRDVFKWTAGTQSDDLKEFFFEGETLEGRWLFKRTDDGWILERPSDQEFDSVQLQKFLDETEELSWFSPFIRIEKAEEKRLVTSIVLQPEITDAQRDITNEDEIEKTAHRFVADYNRYTKIGYMHKDFRRKLQLAESWTTKGPQIIGGKNIKEGTWLMTVKVLDDKVWKGVKAGKIRGFSVGGRAKAEQIS